MTAEEKWKKMRPDQRKEVIWVLLRGGHDTVNWAAKGERISQNKKNSRIETAIAILEAIAPSEETKLTFLKKEGE